MSDGEEGVQVGLGLFRAPQGDLHGQRATEMALGTLPGLACTHQGQLGVSTGIHSKLKVTGSQAQHGTAFPSQDRRADERVSQAGSRRHRNQVRTSSIFAIQCVYKGCQLFCVHFILMKIDSVNIDFYLLEVLSQLHQILLLILYRAPNVHLVILALPVLVLQGQEGHGVASTEGDLALGMQGVELGEDKADVSDERGQHTIVIGQHVEAHAVLWLAAGL